MSLFWSGFWIGVAASYIVSMIVALLIAVLVRKKRSGRLEGYEQIATNSRRNS